MAEPSEVKRQRRGADPSTSDTKHTHRRPKPWDTDDIDHWRIEPFTEADSSGPFLEESSFATLFPAYRETYLREVWPLVTQHLERFGIACELNLIEGSMTVRTTRKTRDPFILFRARDFIKLLSRSVPVGQAAKILHRDDLHADVISIGGLVRNRERFVKRRQRLIGSNGSTLKAIELLTECYVLVQGNTVSAMGSHKGLKQVRAIVLDCMRNVHPVYHIKKLMIKRELAKDPALATENWERFLPQFKKKPRRRPPAATGAGASSRPASQRTRKEYSPFPPPQPPRKIDLQIESGEYFMTEPERRAARVAEKRRRSSVVSEQRRRERERAYEAPGSDEILRSRERRRQRAEAPALRDTE